MGPMQRNLNELSISIVGASCLQIGFCGDVFQRGTIPTEYKKVTVTVAVHRVTVAVPPMTETFPFHPVKVEVTVHPLY